MAESVQIKAVSTRHEAIADWLLANPHKKRSELAAEMGLSESWLSIVTRSSVFIEYFRKRREEVEEDLRAKITGAQLKVTLEALEKLSAVINTDNVDGRLVLDIAEKTAARLGFEPRKSKLVEEREQTFVRPAGRETILSAGEKITRKIISEVEVNAAPAGGA